MFCMRLLLLWIVTNASCPLVSVGRSHRDKLNALSVTTCGDLQQLSLREIQRELGVKTGQTLFNFCRGQDERQIRSERVRKSVSAEINYGMRFTEAAQPEAFLVDLAQEVSKRLREAGVRGKSVTLKLKVRSKDAPVTSAKFMGARDVIQNHKISYCITHILSE